MSSNPSWIIGEFIRFMEKYGHNDEARWERGGYLVTHEEDEDTGEPIAQVDLVVLASQLKRICQGCDRPPIGWWCSREPGHDGPCAAHPCPIT